jgi:hypothetical protein
MRSMLAAWLLLGAGLGRAGATPPPLRVPTGCARGETPVATIDGGYCQRPPPPVDCPPGRFSAVVGDRSICARPPASPCPEGAVYKPNSYDGEKGFCEPAPACEDSPCPDGFTCRRVTLTTERTAEPWPGAAWRVEEVRRCDPGQLAPSCYRIDDLRCVAAAGYDTVETAPSTVVLLPRAATTAPVTRPPHAPPPVRHACGCTTGGTAAPIVPAALALLLLCRRRQRG